MFKIILCVAHSHDLRLVALAALVCAVATLVTFYLYSRTPAARSWRRWASVGLTGVVAGCGIWTTHFVAMLAFKTGLPTGYEAAETLGSLGVAIVSTATGFAVGSSRLTRARPRVAAVAGGLIVGLGITFMHYVGMTGYRTTGLLRWDQGYVALSVLLGAAASAAALIAAPPGARSWRPAAGGALLTLGIVGMHFTGMTAVTIVPDARVTIPARLMSDGTMVIAAVAATALIVVAAIAAVAIDAANRGDHLRKLREALDVMPEGLAFFDANDRLVAWNARYAELCCAMGARLTPGLAFSDLLETEVIHGSYPDARGREDAWIAERQAVHSGARASLTHQAAGGRWLRVTDRRTADGGTVSVSVDITELKRAEASMAAARDRAEELARRAEAAEAIAGLGHWRVEVASGAVTWSPQLYRIYGIEPGAPLDVQTLIEMRHPEDRLNGEGFLERQMAGGPPETWVSRIIRRDGQVLHLSSSVSAERDPNGEVVALIGSSIDVTEQKKAEAAVAESEERFRRLAVNAPDIITETTLDGVLTYVSPAVTPITGFTPEELLGRSFVSLVEPDDARKVMDMCAAVFASKGAVAPWPVQYRARKKTGERIWLESKPTLAVDPLTGRFTGATDVIRDITQRKALEADLRQARAEAETAAAAKADFLANMSHELRTPLTSIIGFTGLAAEQADLSDLTRDYVGRVRDASRALLCTVNDILDFSKLEAGQVTIEPRPVVLAALTREALNLFTPQAGAKDLRLVLDQDPADSDLVVSVDPDRIRQILLNFVCNAVKFTAQGSVTLRSRYDHDAQRLAIEVIDTGDGIAPDKQDKLFKRFSQIDGARTRTGGTGLGLAICKGLVEAMGGEVGVESRPGHGSRFWFAIPAPVAQLRPGETAGQAFERLSFDGVRVLVADDHPANRELARLFLNGVGAEVVEAEDGEQAVLMAAQMPYDAILMDVRMPGLDGPGALARIREGWGPNQNTPILAYTADGDQALIGELKLRGFQDVVAKPVQPGALISAVARATAFVDLAAGLEAQDAA
jgi:PAS domain S-box-containing protein